MKLQYIMLIATVIGLMIVLLTDRWIRLRKERRIAKQLRDDLAVETKRLQNERTRRMQAETALDIRRRAEFAARDQAKRLEGRR